MAYKNVSKKEWEVEYIGGVLEKHGLGLSTELYNDLLKMVNINVKKKALEILEGINEVVEAGHDTTNDTYDSEIIATGLYTLAEELEEKYASNY